MRSSTVATAGPGSSVERAARLSANPILYVDHVESPLGDLLIAADHDAVHLVEFVERASLPAQLDTLTKELGCTFQDGGCALTEVTARQLEEYFAGKRREFTVPLATPGSRLQLQVWDRIAATPFGATVSYGAIAREIGRPRAYRAVGRSTGQNRLALLVPCHRVVAANGALTGYAAGTSRKRWLLEHEGAIEGGRAVRSARYR